jgi:hypothetical protein
MMAHSVQVEVEDLSKSASNSDLVAVVHYHAPDRTIEIMRDGSVRFLSAAGTVTAHFRETEKRDLLRQNYIQMLLASGVRGEEFASALAAIERVDRRLATSDRVKSEAALEQRTQMHLRGWAASRKLDYDTLSEDEWQNQIQQAIMTVRRSVLP